MCVHYQESQAVSQDLSWADQREKTDVTTELHDNGAKGWFQVYVAFQFKR